MTTWDGFYSLAGTEFANEERFRSYLATLGQMMPFTSQGRALAEYDGTFRAVGDAPYTTPLADRAPWIDIDDPVTHDFLGMTVLSVENLSDSTRTASAIEGLGRGATVGAARDGSREIRFTALLAGLTEESVIAGRTWLSRVLWNGRNDQPLVPSQPGVSDLRFFVEQPNLVDQVVNEVRNPTGAGLAESMIGAAGQAYAFRVPGGAAWAYRMQTRVATDAEMVLAPIERPTALSGQQWVARARIWRAAAVLGHRRLNLLLRFRDQYGNVILGAGLDDTSVPDGVLYRWAGAKWDSVSQRLDINGMVQNFVVNPTGDGSVLGLAPLAPNPATVALITTSALDGPRGYQVTANTPATAAVRSVGTAPATPGRQWWGRARGRLTRAYGARSMRADLQFVDDAGTEVSRMPGPTIVKTPVGTFRRWRGTRNASISEEYTNGVRRLNLNPNPTVRDNLTGYQAVGPVSVARERFPSMGFPQVVRVTPTSTGTADVAGVALPVTGLPLGEYDIVFWVWTDGPQTLRLQGSGWRAAGDTGSDVNNQVSFASAGASVATLVKIHVTVTAAAQSFRIARAVNTVGNSFRFGRVGVLTGGSSYFDGDTGTYEYEGVPRKSSSVGHLAGDADQMNMLLNSGFEDGITYWVTKPSTALTYDKPNRRMVVTATAAIGAGIAIVEEQGHTDTLGGSRIHLAAHIYNQGAAAVTVAAQIRWEGANTAWLAGPSVTIPAGGDAWVATNAPIQIPGGVTRVIPQFVTVNSLPSGSKLSVGHPIMTAGAPAAAPLTEAGWFDGDTVVAAGATFDSSAFDFTVGGVSPARATGVRLVLNRLGDATSATEDQFLTDTIMLTQQDPIDDGDPSTPVATVLPDYFDGTSASTFNLLPTTRIDSDPGAGLTDGTVYDVSVTAAAPPGAVAAEVAVQREGIYDAAVEDLIYADNVMLASYSSVTPPPFTALTRHQQIADKERWLQEVYPIAGPSVLEEHEYGPGGCNGYGMKVEFSITAENPLWLRDSAVIPLPVPTAFAKVVDSAGTVKNYMPQFGLGSSQVPGQWVTTQDLGVTTIGSYQATPVSPRVLTLKAADANTRFGHYFRAIGVLGDKGGFESAIASLWVGSSIAGAKLTITVEAHNGNGPVLGSASTVWTAPDASTGDILNDAHRVNLTLPPVAAGGATDGFIIYVHPESAFGTLYLGVPQVTLTPAAAPMIYGGLPDKDGYTYSFDGFGYSTRKPVQRTQSRTVFPNLTAPPVAISSMSGYNETGVSSMRTYAAIPPELVPASAAAVPVARIDFERMLTRQCRIRFYPNPQNVAPAAIDTSSWVEEWIVRPFNGNVDRYATIGFMSLAIDGVSQRVWLRAYDGTVIPGDQYVTTSDGAPIGWPEFRGTPWVVSVDYPTFHMSAAEPATEDWWRVSLALVVEE